MLRVDGGMVASDWTMQGGLSWRADKDRPTIMDLAGLQSGLYPDPPAFAARWALDRRFTAAMDETTRSRKITAWKHAVHRMRAAMTLSPHRRAVHFIGGLGAGRGTYVSVGAVGDIPFCSSALSSPS